MELNNIIALMQTSADLLDTADIYPHVLDTAKAYLEDAIRELIKYDSCEGLPDSYTIKDPEYGE